MLTAVTQKTSDLSQPLAGSTDSAIVLPEFSLVSRPEIASLMPSLEALVNDLSSRLKIFPHLCCELAATRVMQLGIGLTYVDGTFTQGIGGHTHSWNMSSELGVYVDVTARQFSDSLPSILVVPIESEFARKHYLRDWHLTW